MTFDVTVNKLLTEIPYIEYINSFDIQLETRKNVDSLMEFLSELFNGKEFTDKYNNSIKLDTDESKKFFVNNLYKDPIFTQWIKRQSEEDRNKLKEFIRAIYFNLSTKKPRSHYM
jgi:hypothetical protein